MDAGITVALIMSGGAAVTAVVSAAIAAASRSRVDRRSLAIQELEASLKTRSEDITAALARVDNLDGRLNAAEKEKWNLKRENDKLTGRVATLEKEVTQLEQDKAVLQRDVEKLTKRLQTLESGPPHD